MNETIGPSDVTRQPCDLEVGAIYTYEREHMNRLVETMAGSGDDLSVRLLLVDNASLDGTRAWEDTFHETVTLRNPRRMGYSANLNRILSIASAPFVLLMNTDMHFNPSEQCLSKMVRFMQMHPDCGVSICRILHPDGTYAFPARRFPTLSMVAARRLLQPGRQSRHLDAYFYSDQDHRASFECDWVSGCFMMLRREAIRQAGPFDERFAKYFEDVDMCCRIAHAGWRVMFHGGTYCYHHEQRASQRLFSRAACQHVASYVRWLAKWKWPRDRLAAEARPLPVPGNIMPVAVSPHAAVPVRRRLERGPGHRMGSPKHHADGSVQRPRQTTGD